MTQQPNATRQTTFWGQRFLIRRLSYLSGVGILGSGAAIAQAPSNVPPIVSAPSISQSASSANTSERLAPALGSAPTPPERSAAEQIQIDVRTATSPGVTAPLDSYEAPSTIVITNRSSGCEITLDQGQAIADGACGSQRPVAAIAHVQNDSAVGGNIESVQVNSTPTTQNLSNSPATVTTASIAAPAYSFVKDYYNRTTRPLGRLGNGNLRLMFPIAIPAAITSVFGWRTHPITGDARFHSGTDLGAPMGTPVLAALAGRVVLADFFGGYGLAIALEHDNGKQQTLYGHLSEIFVKPGEVVKQGTAIGRVGSTGNSTGPHLHFEFRQLTTEGWVAQDPGAQLETALAQLVKSLQTAQKTPIQPGGNTKS